MALLSYTDVTLGYGARTILEKVNLCVEQGDFFGLVGPNGAGKSTLIKSMLGLLKAQSGKILWNPETVQKGYVPQRENIDPIWPMRVRDILRLTHCSLRGPFHRHRGEDSRVMEEMERIGIAHLANQTLDTLSGGELQRLLLARALITDPQVLILDEPTAAMDLVSSNRFLSLINTLHEERNMTVIIVTHDLPSLVHRAHRIGIIQDGQLHSGTTREMITSEKLSEIYQENLAVSTIDGRTIIYSQEETQGVVS
ncbi:metal ABC transporter ATP-binding protein [Chitinivibrio alkaliphilus]|uniref:ABC transporter ATP-binding protein n=1 Tax=Chitinivibrio alkaliphilus ACht1 TaxID=1313304 RepID=U7D618_9BACT|nr:metal ABC transporter ATP-binding protein [Chitinivibrio alkaliphilus]ERP31959.1 ABC transporter ATP-binding protein [Chitinivibrio alkaliphilus ACht1]